MISIVIPVVNEQEVLRRHGDAFKSLREKAELIFVDGGSTDVTTTLAAGLGICLKAEKNRAIQMNAGARAAQGDILLFLHADNVVTLEHLGQIEQAIQARGWAGGCFRQVLDQPGWIFRWIAWTGNVRARLLKIFYGDQGLFVRRDVFERVGGFPVVPLCEDVYFSKRLRREGLVGVLPCPVHSSARRWLRQGILKTFWLNLQVHAALALGRDLAFLARRYQDVREDGL